MSLLSWFTGDNNVADNVLDKDNGLLTQFGSWIGNANYTEEEQAEGRMLVMTGAAKFTVDTMSEGTVRSKARREIAILWIKAQLILIFWVMVVAPFNIELAKFYATIVFGSLMIFGTMSVIVFFFGPYMLGQHTGLAGKIGAIISGKK